MKTIDRGDICLDCFKDTSFGSGRFVDRVPAVRQEGVDADIEEGYICAECLNESEDDYYAT